MKVGHVDRSLAPQSLATAEERGVSVTRASSSTGPPARTSRNPPLWQFFPQRLRFMGDSSDWGKCSARRGESMPLSLELEVLGHADAKVSLPACLCNAVLCFFIRTVVVTATALVANRRFEDGRQIGLMRSGIVKMHRVVSCTWYFGISSCHALPMHRALVTVCGC